MNFLVRTSHRMTSTLQEVNKIWKPSFSTISVERLLTKPKSFGTVLPSTRYEYWQYKLRHRPRRLVLVLVRILVI
jgi:hypothetical protein